MAPPLVTIISASGQKTYINDRELGREWLLQLERAQVPSAHAAIGQSHADIMQLLASATGQHFRGLTQAALHVRGRLDGATLRDLKQLDVAYAVSRHFDSVVAEGLQSRVRHCLDCPTTPRDVPPRRDAHGSEDLPASPQQPLKLEAVPPFPDLTFTPDVFDLAAMDAGCSEPPIGQRRARLFELGHGCWQGP